MGPVQPGMKQAKSNDIRIAEIRDPFLADFYGMIISLMNTFISWVSHQEEFLFKEISVSFQLMLYWYVVIFLGIYFLLHKTSIKLIYFFISIALLQSVFLLESNKNKSKEEIIVFHKSRFSMIGKRIGERLLLQHNIDSLRFLKENSIKSYKIAESIAEIKETNFKNIISFSNKYILLIDSLGIYQISGMNAPIVLMQYSPKINMTRLIKKIEPSQIIVDGSNYKSDVIRWENICIRNNVPFHYTGIKGAYILKN